MPALALLSALGVMQAAGWRCAPLLLLCTFAVYLGTATAAVPSTVDPLPPQVLAKRFGVSVPAFIANVF